MIRERADRPRIEKLQRTHEVDAFDCGQEPLNRYLKRYALVNQRADGAQTYVGVSGKDIIGYYTLVVGNVAYEDAPERLAKGLSRHPVPVMLLARLAVDLSWQGKGAGAGLLRDAMQRTLQAADIAGIRAFLVHAKDDKARAFYEHFNFFPSPTDPYHLYLLVKDIRKAMAC
ncbi:GCN5-related N-acetyltransferase (plasmid) [Nitrosococcus halophilus Nc 4]|uniref:GCN5-related N-acetyltransferase n=1 Tax=Nitrosococcus halophilus (strain Nc4) TaxID=472759 RepID=D5C5D6_NITHN|nr:GNAT family N-acetyltransferase [Nitrosococcus halophilus]ADE16990.1 GCN5-related N-acetyltransferase [Nitrosococcus halophilus Nc 4]